RAAAAVECHEWRHELRRPAPGTPLLRRTAGARDSVLHAAARGETGTDRMGAGQIPVRLLDRRRHREAPLRPVLHQTSVDRVRPDHRARYGQSDSVRKGRQVRSAPGPPDIWGAAEQRPLVTVARNVSTRYLAIATDALI